MYQNISSCYVSGKSNFDLKNAIIDMTGNYSSTISYRVRFDLGGLSVGLLDAYAEWKPFSFIGVKFGEFQLPYTFENQYIPKTLETADNSQVISSLVFNGSKGRDIGININGSILPMSGYNLIEYKLAALNGNGFNKVDDNLDLDLLGSLYVNPIQSLSVVGSYLSGRTTTVGAAKSQEKHITAFGAKYEDAKLLIRAEYINGTTLGVNSSGYYGVIGYFINSHIQPILKYDYYQSNMNNQNSGTTKYLVGLNYWLASKTRLMLSYNYSVSKDPAVKEVGLLSAGCIVTF